jgi:hypothetical protein
LQRRCEELVGLGYEEPRVLVERSVIRIRVDDQLGVRDLRADLHPIEQEKLGCLLAAVLSGETVPEVWRATLNAVAALRRAAEPAVGAPRRWRQTWPAEQE